MACAPQTSILLGNKVKNGTHVGFAVDCDRHLESDKEKYSEYSGANSSSESNEHLNDTCSSNIITEKPLNGLNISQKLGKKSTNVQFEDYKRPKASKSLKKLVGNLWLALMPGLTAIDL